MNDIKDLPSEVELDALAQTDEYKTIDDTLTVKQLQTALTDIEVEYLSADNKPDLIWRYMDAQGTLPADEPVTTTDPAPADPVETDARRASRERGLAQHRNRIRSTKPAAATHVSIKNIGSFNVLEPSTTTLMLAGKVTEIEIAAGKSKQQIIGNIQQFNRTRGNILKIV